MNWTRFREKFPEKQDYPICMFYIGDDEIILVDFNDEEDCPCWDFPNQDDISDELYWISQRYLNLPKIKEKIDMF